MSGSHITGGEVIGENMAGWTDFKRACRVSYFNYNRKNGTILNKVKNSLEDKTKKDRLLGSLTLNQN